MPDASHLFAFAWRTARYVPGPILRGTCNLGADVAWLRRGSGVRRLEQNLARVRPDLDPKALRRLTRLGMRSYLRYFGEAFTLGAATQAQVDARVRGVGTDEVRDYCADRRAAILAVGHSGNWDLAGAWATRHVAPVTTVAERLKPEALFQEFLAFRESLGMRILALGDGDVFRELVRTARGGPALVPLLADRDLTARGVEATMFGHPVRVAAGPAALSITTGAPIYATLISYERLRGERRRAAGTPWGIVLEFVRVPPVEEDVPRAERVAVLTQRWLDVYAESIARHPQDWHMLQRVFAEDLDPARSAQVAAATAGADGAHEAHG